MKKIKIDNEEFEKYFFVGLGKDADNIVSVAGVSESTMYEVMMLCVSVADLNEKVVNLIAKETQIDSEDVSKIIETARDFLNDTEDNQGEIVERALQEIISKMSVN